MGRFTEMKLAISYCKTWFRAKKRPTEIWTEEQAKAAHLSRTLYTALIGSVEKPFCFLEINDKFVGVGFLDDRAREYLYYAFKEMEPGRLFLSMATYREFDGETDTVVLGTSYIFNPIGTVKTQKQHFKPHSVEMAESSIDVSGNYSSWPEFGEYDELIRVDRS
jgi:hypothetical protein